MFSMDSDEPEDMAAPTVFTFSMVIARRVTSSASSEAFSWSQPSGMDMVTFTVFRSMSGMNTNPRCTVSTAEPISSTTDAPSTAALCRRAHATALR